MTEESEKTGIKQLIQSFTGEGIEVLQGTVKSASPLKIQIVNDDKLMIGPGNVYVPRHLTDYTATCDLSKGARGYVNGPTTDGSKLTDFTFSGSITVHNALQHGETVHVLSFNHGKQYYVLDRVG